MPTKLFLRDVITNDLETFFQNQLDHEANQMAAFTIKDPSDKEVFNAHWQKILKDESVIIKTIIFKAEVTGSVLSYENDGKAEVSYWLGKKFWGQGIATWALNAFLKEHNKTRPVYARVAKDNLASRRILEKSNFVIINESTGYANARGREIEEFLYEKKD
ncbi:MAG: GNAT family N-acetyltransferase [Anaerolineae bacterium]|jgi:RimJ/RimL family protein N-acetyltransferase|nr:GNAT family N-acetyltransferase [Anaerolineae bacterium]MBT7189439.1 GNAT family N-acetyltransferase [Anaerolineae bacterium]MBT7988520.1 GNAT family N-acetyltransferase [Anaerolineae bacterium]